ncbi:hypothetical protein U14_05129 [Candidatus Moduliflexus flocculans]|uniref:FecR protein domain-containing protein n=1 Tax=Candidatus Moduliflexus flocculans TaxID=1499966 RepID=A0A081BR24_9BACT|nr:hypothetical protein U14_05129 [Candidatus Moduliflexus flocculans]
MNKKFITLLLLLIVFWAVSPASAETPETVEIVFTQEMSLRALAEQYLGSPNEWNMLLKYNGLEQLADLQPGMSLTIPTGSFQRFAQALGQAAETARLANMEGAGVLSKTNIDEANRLQTSAIELKNSGKLAEAEAAASEAAQWAEKALNEAKAKKIQAVSAILSEKEGSVQNRKPADSSWADTTVKQDLNEQERVRTLAASLAGILFTDGSKINLNENSLAVIGTMKENVIRRSFQAEVTVLQGDVLAHLSALGGKKDFTINAPGVDTTIRSKKFRTTRSEGDVTRIANYDGEIDVAANQGKVTIKKDEGTKIEKGQKPTAPKKLLLPPVMLSPTVNQVFFSATIPFEWEAVSNAAFYQLEISPTRDFTNILASERVSGTQYAWQVPQQGVYYYRMYTVDNDEFAGPFSDTFAFFAQIDTSAPFLSVVSPADGAVLLTADVAVRGAVEKEAALTINGQPVESDANGNFDTTLQLKPGEQTITITATDAARNVASVQRQVFYNTAAQLLTLDMPTQIVTNQQQVTLKGEIRPQTRVEMNDVPIELPLQFTHVLTLPEGEQTVTLKAISPQNDVQTVPLHIIVDLTPPEITVKELPASTREPNVNLTGSVSESAALTLDANAIPAQNNRFTIPITLKEGENVLNVTATDPAGNATTKTLRMLLDTTPPEITQAACSLPEAKGGEIIACEVAAQDRGIGLAKTGKFGLAIGQTEQPLQGVLTLNQAKGVFEGSVFVPPKISGRVTIKELRIQDRLGNEASRF